MAIVTGIVAIYYNVVISWCVYYIGHSFYKTLPWATCGNPWNTPGCLERLSKEEVSNSSQFDTNATDVMVTVSVENTTNMLASDAKFVIFGNQTFVARTPTEEFWAWVFLIWVCQDKSSCMLYMYVLTSREIVKKYSSISFCKTMLSTLTTPCLTRGKYVPMRFIFISTDALFGPDSDGLAIKLKEV